MINIVRRGVIGFGMGQVGRGGPGRRNGASRDISEEVFAVFLVSRSLRGRRPLRLICRVPPRFFGWKLETQQGAFDNAAPRWGEKG